VKGFEVGDRVFYHGNLSRPGGFAEYVVTVAHVLARIPHDVSFVSAAAIPCAGLTAYQALHRRLHIQAGQTVLVQAGAGGVGGFAVQLAAQAGARVITTASRENHAYVRGLGAEAVIDYRQEDVHERVMAWTNDRGVDAVVDTLGGEIATAGTKLLAFGGGLTAVAGLPDFSQVPFHKALSIHQIMLGGAYFNGGYEAQSDLARMGEEMIAMVAAGEIDPMVSKVIGLEDVPAGLEELTGRHVRGKIVAEVANRV
jgi:NADPH2:quinone reductase